LKPSKNERVIREIGNHTSKFKPTERTSGRTDSQFAVSEEIHSKMNEDNDAGGWEVASGGRKKSKAKTKQPQASTNITPFHNGANTNTQKSQFKDVQGGQKASQRKLCSPQYASAASQKKSLSDRKDQNRNNSGSLAKPSAPSQPALANTIPSGSGSSSTALTNKPSKSKNVISELSHINDLATCPPSNVVNGHGTSSNQGESYQTIQMPRSAPNEGPISDSNGNILDHNIHKQSVIQESNRKEHSKNVLIDKKFTTSVSCLHERKTSSNQLSDRNTSYVENIETTRDAPVTVAGESPSNTEKRTSDAQVPVVIRENSSLIDKNNDTISQSHIQGQINTQANHKGIIRFEEMLAYVKFV